MFKPQAVVHSPRRLATKLFYGFGSVAYGVKDNGFSVFLLVYYNQVLGLPAKWVGFAAMIALILDAFIDPLVGYWSDNLRTRWGRRHPLMYAAALPAGLSFALLWNPPAGLDHAQLFLYLLVLAVIVRVFITFYEIPSSALVAELTMDYDDRTSFLGYRFFFGWWGGLTMSLVAYQFFLRPDAAHPVGQLNPQGYAHYGVAGSAIMIAAILVSALGTHGEIKRFKVQPKRPPFNLERNINEIFSTLNHYSFLMMLLAGIFGSMAVGLTFGLGIYFNTFFWGLTSDQISILVLGNYVSAAGALILGPVLSRRFGKKRTAIWLSLFGIFVGPIPFVLRLVGAFPSNGSRVLLPILFVFSTIVTMTSILAAILTSSMVADVVEDSEVMTGRRNEGLFFSANSLILKCVSGVGIFGSGLTLDLVGFPQNAKPGAVSVVVLDRLALAYVPLIAALYLISIACVSAYRISRDRHEENVRQVSVG